MSSSESETAVRPADPSGDRFVERRRRRSRRSESKSKEQIAWLKRVILGVTSALLLTVVVGGIVIVNATTQRTRVLSQLRQAERTLASREIEFEELRHQMAEVVQARIPGLTELEFDRIVEFRESPMRTLVFAQIRDNERVAYEYHAVMENRNVESGSPEVRVVLFDEMGFQTGEGPIVVGELRPREVKSYTGTADVISDRPPKYFAVVTQSGMLSTE